MNLALDSNMQSLIHGSDRCDLSRSGSRLIARHRFHSGAGTIRAQDHINYWLTNLEACRATRYMRQVSLMLVSVPLRVLELLTARLCHDLISPVAAIANGAELLGENDPDFVNEAIALVGTSARNANARLQFFRFAFGFGGGGLAGFAPHQLAAEYFAGTAVACDYGEGVRALPLEGQKLACAMLLVAGDALSRGGRVLVSVASGGAEVEAIGDAVTLSAETGAALTGTAEPSELTTITVTAYFAGLLAASQGRVLVANNRPG
ncbi:MAG: histidine phosphotransferase family protein, partial [Alphaproteobacteria bacterium]